MTNMNENPESRARMAQVLRDLADNVESGQSSIVRVSVEPLYYPCDVLPYRGLTTIETVFAGEVRA